jgi:DNA helicase HerA-like ATPase
MQDFEKLGLFYLGKQQDPESGADSGELVLYDAKDLCTHALCMGMTGSGKTGLGISLLEEAAIDGIPVLAIDPKGDLGNLLLGFPDLRAEDFRPWIDESEAARRGETPDAHARMVAERWKDGLAEWGQDGGRIRRFLDAARPTIYTPGSTAGLPISVLRSFDAPPAALLEDADALRDRIQAAVSGLLALLNVDADPLRSREHILLATLLDRSWRAGENLDMADLIRAIQDPGIERIGVLDLESFFPSAERFALAMQLNNLLASPGFETWMAGEALDLQSLLYDPAGRPRMAILSIAHLSEAERMFFVTVLLNEVVAWMRAQPGTSSLRALVYMDEVFGYFPPTANPPSKKPMLTLLKQARAYGVGVVLATQNPVDLDYKGLSNIGTWFIGRLQTERDKMRVLDGLDGAGAGDFDRADMERRLGSLGKRVFLLHNVHEPGPTTFRTRWALSYLRGPLSRSQIQTLMADRRQPVSPPSAERSSAAGSAPPQETTGPASAPVGGDRPALPPEIEQLFLASASAPRPGARLVHRPAVLAVADLHFVRASCKLDTWRAARWLVPLSSGHRRPDWSAAEPLEAEGPTVVTEPPPGDLSFARLPASAARAASFSAWKKQLATHLYQNGALTLWTCPSLKLVSSPEEDEAQFRIRASQRARERRDEELEKLRSRYAPRLQTLEDRLRRARGRVEREASQARSQGLDAAVSIGSSVLGAVLGRKLGGRRSVGSAVRRAGRLSKERGDVHRAREEVEALEQRRSDLDAELRDKMAALQDELDPALLELEPLVVRPRKSDISFETFALVWTPWTVDEQGIAERAF